mmetsp:Transcript_32212/g.78278  ORF Transcript_32212/g.78278 Transcript_32212/m.78278 type:complete len:482 (-) Transcript_32212:55-1500(-)
MVFLRLEGCCYDVDDVDINDDTTQLPNDIDVSTTDAIVAPTKYYFENDFERYRSSEVSSSVLTKLLKGSSKKFGSIEIRGSLMVSPENLALLTAIFSNTDRLSIADGFSRDLAFGCLSSGLLQRDGPKYLEFTTWDNEVTTYQAKLLCEGVASSSCLEKLFLNGIDFEDDYEACCALLDALHRNRSLKRLTLRLQSFGSELMFQRLFQTAVLDTQLCSLDIFFRYNDHFDPFRRLSSNVLANIMGQSECRLESLTLKGVKILPARADQLTATTNTLVKKASLHGTALDSTLLEIVAPFQALISIDLRDNNISDLSPLDPLLIGSSLTLQNLNLVENKISAKNAIDFFRKLPRMTCIRSISLHSNPFLDSNTWMDALTNGIWQNKSLECFSFFPEERKDYFAKLSVPLSLNRGWRRAIAAGSANGSKDLPLNLWPLIVERAMKASYDECRVVSYLFPQSTATDVVFWLLRDQMVSEHSLLLG